MGCFSVHQGRHRAKDKLSSAPAASSLLAQPSLKLRKELKIGNLSSRFSNSCNNSGRDFELSTYRHISHGIYNPCTRAKAVFRSASSKLVRQHPKRLTSISLSKARSFHKESENRGASGRYSLGMQETITSYSAPLASRGNECAILHLFPLPLPPSDTSATSTSEDSSLQSMSNSSSASSSSSCSSAPFPAFAESPSSQMRKSYACVTSSAETNTNTSISSAQPLPLPPASEKGQSSQEYSYEELAGACSNFAKEFFIRDGGAGPVFKALVRKNIEEWSGLEIAVTRLSKGRLHSPRKWRMEVGILARLWHPNICKVLGFSREDPSVSVRNLVYVQRERLLVYEHTSNGSLESLLYGRKDRAPPLDWDTRIKIALGAARGLAFLHGRTSRQIIYKVFKTLNIQVDQDFNAKLSDYGFVTSPKKLPIETPVHLFPSECAYAAPETRSCNEVTTKSNVWSFGVVLLELLTGRQNMDDFFAAEERNLLQWCRPHLLEPKRLFLVMDPELKGRYSTREAKMVADLALRCLSDDPEARPSMVDVVAFLSPLAGTRHPFDTKPKQLFLSHDLHRNDNRHTGNGSFLANDVKLSYSKSHSLASVLTSPARSFTANLQSSELYHSQACDSKIRFRGFLSGEFIKGSCHLSAGQRGDYPVVSHSSYLS